jgi:hypothetical protein
VCSGDPDSLTPECVPLPSPKHPYPEIKNSSSSDSRGRCSRWTERLYLVLDGGWVVSITTRPLYCWDQLDRRMLGGHQSRSGRCWNEKNLAPAGIRTLTVQHLARRYTGRAAPTPEYEWRNRNYDEGYGRGHLSVTIIFFFQTGLKTFTKDLRIGILWPESQTHDNTLRRLVLSSADLIQRSITSTAETASLSANRYREVCTEIRDRSQVVMWINRGILCSAARNVCLLNYVDETNTA